MTVEDLMQEFFRSYVKKLLKSNTIRGYRVNIDNHIVPFMGNVELTDITYGLLDDFCGYMSDKGVKNTNHLCTFCASQSPQFCYETRIH